MQTSLCCQDEEFPPVAIEGLSHIANYITEAEEAQLIATIDQQPWLHDLKRCVQHYGYKYDYKARTVTSELKIGPMPDWIETIGTRLYADGLIAQNPDQAIVNEYLPGQGISPHIDCVPCFSGQIISLSLASACVMDFNHMKTGQKTSLLLKPRDLLLLSGAARYEWQHGIAARKSDIINSCKLNRGRRVSLTFRKVIISHLA